MANWGNGARNFRGCLKEQSQFPGSQMSVSAIATRDYETESACAGSKNKANFQPSQGQGRGLSFLRRQESRRADRCGFRIECGMTSGGGSFRSTI